MMTRQIASLGFGLLLLHCLVPAWAHAILLKSTPTAEAVVVTDSIPVSLTFNSRIDGRRSRLTLVGPHSSEQPLALEAQTSPNTLTSKAPCAEPGDYRIRWQVLAVDGHITRGEIRFRVERR
jgi:methionine-rich copper-binding protein CopC